MFRSLFDHHQVYKELNMQHTEGFLVRSGIPLCLHYTIYLSNTMEWKTLSQKCMFVITSTYKMNNMQSVIQRFPSSLYLNIHIEPP